MSNFAIIGRWWENRDIELLDYNGEIFALYNWNGDSYLDCWKVEDNLFDVVNSGEYIITPIYKEVGEDEWVIVDYEIFEE